MRRLIILHLILSVFTAEAFAASAVSTAQPPTNGSITEFAADYTNKHSGKGRNILISTVSIDLALAMTANGAAGQTLEEFENFLGNNLKGINRYYPNLLKSFASQDDVTINVANKIFTNNYPLKKSFNNTLKSLYDAEGQELDFTKSTSAGIINSWVSEKTNGLIDNIINSLNDDDKVILVNTLYFKGAWMLPFNKHATKQRDFHMADGKKSGIEFMYLAKSIKVYKDENNGTQAVILPYEGNRFGFVAVMPQKGTPLQISKDFIDRINNDSSYMNTNLYFPKLDIEYEDTLKKYLMPAGLKLPFSNADFSNMSNGQKIEISDILHKARLKLDEDGTEAAAVTAVVVSVLSMPVKPEEIVFDRPFLFYIWDSVEEIPLFIGTVESL